MRYIDTSVLVPFYIVAVGRTGLQVLQCLRHCLHERLDRHWLNNVCVVISEEGGTIVMRKSIVIAALWLLSATPAFAFTLRACRGMALSSLSLVSAGPSGRSSIPLCGRWSA